MTARPSLMARPKPKMLPAQKPRPELNTIQEPNGPKPKTRPVTNRPKAENKESPNYDFLVLFPLIFVKIENLIDLTKSAESC